MKESIQFRLNGKAATLTVDTNRMLLWVLRTDLGLTGTKYGCGIGQCGSCTVLVNNEAVRSCQFSLSQARDKEVVTIEGLVRNGSLHPVQKAFMQHDALQCGYCTPGMIMNAVSVLREHPKASAQQIIEGMDYNLCRCGAHNRIVQAVQSAAKEMNSRI